MRYEPSSPGFAARAPEVYRVLRDDHPVYRDPDGGFVALSRFEDVYAAATDWERFSSVGKTDPHVKPTMNALDPPRHTRVRALISRAFTPRRVRELEPAIRAVARDRLAGLADRGSFDAIAEFAAPLPSTVMGRLIGLPEDVIPVCRALTDEFMHQTVPHGPEGPATRAYEIFQMLYAERRRVPKDDLLTDLLHAEVDGERLTEDELLAFGWLLLVGGNDTTTNLIGNGLELLARHPDQRRRLVEDPSLLPGAIEEVLRIASPTHTLPRIAATDVVLHGEVIPAGTRVLLLWAAANLDEREFPDPERFDVERRASRHLAFGHGVHFCLGASLARLEAQVALDELLRRFPHYGLAETPEHFPSPTFYGFHALHLTTG